MSSSTPEGDPGRSSKVRQVRGTCTGVYPVEKTLDVVVEPRTPTINGRPPRSRVAWNHYLREACGVRQW